MENTNPISEDIVAPCGMNCAVCSRYLAYVNELKRSQCQGCRPSDKRCEYLFEKCTGINDTTTGKAFFCFECDQYPCKQIDRMDKRYRENYELSVKENLAFIEEQGIKQFLVDQYEIHHCARCGGLISVHNRKCFKCDEVKKLIEKHNKK